MEKIPRTYNVRINHLKKLSDLAEKKTRELGFYVSISSVVNMIFDDYFRYNGKRQT